MDRDGIVSLPIAVRLLGQQDYIETWQRMQAFSAARTADTPDELWLLEHPPVYTLGLNGNPAHLLSPGNIQVVPVDRGGQITYHGPGQIVAYLLLDLRRRGLTVRGLVQLMEQAVIDLLAAHGIDGERRDGAPGVYVGGAKIAALGLRVRRGMSYHGLSLNVDGDLAPFAGINPCGYPDLAVTRTQDLGMPESSAALAPVLAQHLTALLAAAPGSGPVQP